MAKKEDEYALSEKRIDSPHSLLPVSSVPDSPGQILP